LVPARLLRRGVGMENPGIVKGGKEIVQVPRNTVTAISCRYELSEFFSLFNHRCKSSKVQYRTRCGVLAAELRCANSVKRTVKEIKRVRNQ
jgi:hypothetical protein